MTCDQCRQELLVRSVTTFAELAHLDTCPECRALAEKLTTLESAMYPTVTAWVERPFAPALRRVARWPAFLLVAAAAAALWLVVNRPPPEPAPTTRSAVPAVPAPQPSSVIELDSGACVVITLPKPVVSAEVDGSSAQATLLDPERERLFVVGVAPGEAVLRIQLQDTPRVLVYRLAVGPARTEIPADDAGVEVAVGRSAPLALRAEPIAIRTTDPAVATAIRADGRLEVTVTGVRPGIVDLVALYAEGPPDTWVIQVR